MYYPAGNAIAMFLSLLSAVLINNLAYPKMIHILHRWFTLFSRCPLYECSCQQVELEKKCFYSPPANVLPHCSTLNKTFIFSVKAIAEYLDFIWLNVVSIFFYWCLSGWKCLVTLRSYPGHSHMEGEVHGGRHRDRRSEGVSIRQEGGRCV